MEKVIAKQEFVQFMYFFVHAFNDDTVTGDSKGLYIVI